MKKRGNPAEPDTDIYLQCMTEIRGRLDTVMFLNYTEKVFGWTRDFIVESQFIQLRKVLELIAFGSLTANQAKYAIAHAEFERHWKAAKMLGALEKVNPEFYPLPLMVDKKRTEESGRQRFHYRVVEEGVLTKEDFVFLYDISSRVLHTRNPFASRAPIEIQRDIPVWVERIRQLIRVHSMFFVDDRRWLIHVPDTGKVTVFTAMANDSII